MMNVYLHERMNVYLRSLACHVGSEHFLDKGYFFPNIHAINLGFF